MPVYGGTIGQVAQNEMQLGAQQRAAAERQLMMLIQQQQAARNNQQQDRAMSRAEAQDALQQQNWMQSMALRKAEGELARREREREFNLQNQYRHDALREGQRTRRQNILLNRRHAEGAQQGQQERALLPYLQSAADEGAWGSAEEYMSSVPPMMFPYAGMFVPRSLEARKSIGAGYQADLADAELLNEGPAQVERYKHMIEEEGDNSWNPSNHRVIPFTEINAWNTPDKAAIAEWEGEAARIPAARAAILADRNRMARFAPTASGYAPIDPAPSWMQKLPVRTQPKAPVVEPTATNPQTGERIIYRNGTWQPLPQ